MSVSFQETLVQLRGWLRQIVQAPIGLSAFALTGTTLAMAFGFCNGPRCPFALAIRWCRTRACGRRSA